MPPRFQLRLRDAWMLAPTFRHLCLERADGESLPFIPGQFLQIHFEADGKELRRSYSLASYDTPEREAKDNLEIAVSYVQGGAATELLSTLQPGDEITASGPYGRFCLRDESVGRYLLIGTGTGVTPYRSMLPQIARRHQDDGTEFAILYGARTAQELLYDNEFRQFAATVSGLRYMPCFSRGGRSEPLADDREGYVQENLDELNIDPEHDVAYLCGNPEMVDQTFTYLKDLGMPVPNIRREKYISPGSR